MLEEYSVEQEIILLKQDYSLLNGTLENLKQKLKSPLEQEHTQSLQRQITETESELEKLQERLAQLEKNTHPEAVNLPKSQLAPLHHLPLLPNETVVLPSIFNELKAKLVIKPGLSEIANHQKHPLLLHSPSGAGKTFFAALLAQDELVRRTFSDGIFWLTLGKNAKILEHQLDIIKILGGETQFVDLKNSTQQLRKLCQDKTCLFILDDAQRLVDVTAFSELGKACQLLITTNNPQLEQEIRDNLPAVHCYYYTAFNQKQLAEFFFHRLQPTITVSPFIQEAMALCERYPIALKFLAEIVNTNPTIDWEIMLLQLKMPLVEFDDTCHRPILMRILHTIVEELGDGKEYYLALAVFLNYTHIPQTAVTMLWQYLYHLTHEQTRELLGKLARKCLLQTAGTSPHNYIFLHSFQYDYLCTFADVDKLNIHLLAAYRRYCQHRWISGVHDGYFFEYLPTHLFQAGCHKELYSLLLDFNWLNKKLQYTSLANVLNDYELLNNPDLKLVKEVLYQSAPILLRDKRQLANQLVKYSWTTSSSSLQTLLQQARDYLDN